MPVDPRAPALLAASGSVLSRRSLVLALAATGAGLVAACDLVPEPERDPADEAGPSVPPPATEPLADTAVLRRTWRETQELQDTAARISAPQEARETLAETRRILGVQQAVLGRLVQAQQGEDATGAEDTSGRSAPGPGEAAAQTGEVDASVAQLAAALAPVEATTTALRQVSGSNLPTLLSLHGARFASAEELGGSVQWGPVTGPSEAAAVTLLAGLRQAVYGFEVLAGRSSDQERERYRAVLGTLRPLARTVTELAGRAAPAPPLGYGWDQQLNTTAQRRRAAQELARALPAAVMAGASARAGDADAIDGTLRVLATVVEVGVRVGVPLPGFPGLTVPELPA